MKNQLFNIVMVIAVLLTTTSWVTAVIPPQRPIFPFHPLSQRVEHRTQPRNPLLRNAERTQPQVSVEPGIPPDNDPALDTQYLFAKAKLNPDKWLQTTIGELICKAESYDEVQRVAQSTKYTLTPGDVLRAVECKASDKVVGELIKRMEWPVKTEGYYSVHKRVLESINEFMTYANNVKKQREANQGPFLRNRETTQFHTSNSDSSSTKKTPLLTDIAATYWALELLHREHTNLVAPLFHAISDDFEAYGHKFVEGNHYVSQHPIPPDAECRKIRDQVKKLVREHPNMKEDMRKRLIRLFRKQEEPMWSKLKINIR